MNCRPARAISHSVLGCPQAESRINSPPGPESSLSRSRLWAISDTSAALPGSGRTYNDTPSAVAACNARTWRPTPWPCAQPLATSAESSYAPHTRSAVRSTCSRPASIPNRSIARAASVPRSVSAYTARISSARPSRSSFKSAAGIPRSSCNAAPEAHPAMSYNGDGEHNRLQNSAATASPTESCWRPRCGSARSTVATRSSAVMKCHANSSGPTSRRTPAIGGSSRAKEPISCSSWPDALSSSSRPSVLSTRWRTRPCSSR